MKDFFEKIKDFLYDSIDYIIMIAIIGVVVLVIGWRLDLLFTKDASNMDTTDIVQDNDTTKNDTSSGKSPLKDENMENKGQEDDNIDNDTEGDGPNDLLDQDLVEDPVTPPINDSTSANSNIIKINIPSGSLPGKIGSILEEKGLIASKDDFVEKSQELKLDTKLRSGDFEIKEGSTLEEILKIIAK